MGAAVLSCDGCRQRHQSIEELVPVESQVNFNSLGTASENPVQLEGLFWSRTGSVSTGVGVIVCHPHPQFAGNLHNSVVRSVVTSLQRHSFVESTLRFNFRGVGGSKGNLGNGLGEIDNPINDCAGAVEFLRRESRVKRIVIVGYSFGAAVGLACASRYSSGFNGSGSKQDSSNGGGAPVEMVILIAPPISFVKAQVDVGFMKTWPKENDQKNSNLGSPRSPLLHVICGSSDEYCPINQLRSFAATLDPQRVTTEVINHANHFLQDVESRVAKRTALAILRMVSTLSNPSIVDQILLYDEGEGKDEITVLNGEGKQKKGGEAGNKNMGIVIDSR